MTHDDDADAFAEAMGDVARLKADPRGRLHATPDGKPARVVATGRATRAPKEHEDDIVGGYLATGVDRRELKRLRRGEYPPAHRLDLHHMTRVDAIERVARFIESHSGRHKAVAIVHGRGLHSEGNVAVLKACVRERLRAHPDVLAYADAPRADGGDGAVYVLLRRSRT